MSRNWTRDGMARYIPRHAGIAYFVTDVFRDRHSRNYKLSEMQSLVDWLNDRAAGYPAKKFQPLPGWPPCSDEEGATWIRDRYYGPIYP